MHQEFHIFPTFVFPEPDFQCARARVCDMLVNSVFVSAIKKALHFYICLGSNLANVNIFLLRERVRLLGVMLSFVSELAIGNLVNTFVTTNFSHLHELISLIIS